MNFYRSIIVLISTILLFGQVLLIHEPVQAITTSDENITPPVFSPDENGLNDTLSISFKSTASQTLYLNIYYDLSEIVRIIVILSIPCG
jgi:hypothetical protein